MGEKLVSRTSFRGAFLNAKIEMRVYVWPMESQPRNEFKRAFLNAKTERREWCSPWNPSLDFLLILALPSFCKCPEVLQFYWILFARYQGLSLRKQIGACLLLDFKVGEGERYEDSIPFPAFFFPLQPSQPILRFFPDKLD